MMERAVPVLHDPVATSLAPDARQARMEALLAAYPDLSADETEELLRWFQDEASALDVGLVASNEAIRGNYRAFRAKHVDPLTRRELAGTIAIAVALIGLLFAVMLTS